MILTLIALILLAFSIVGLFLLQSKAEKAKDAALNELQQLRDTHKSETDNLRNRYEEIIKNLRDELTVQINSANEKLSKTEIENGKLVERLKFFEEEKSRIASENEERFKNLANEILEANSRRFKEQNESRLGEILQPLKSDIEQFKKTVTDTYAAESRERFSLQERLKELVELNRSIGREAKELTDALRGNSKIQGDWGEMILETILEKSGLKRDVHFSVQLTTDEEGKTLRGDDGHHLRPDVVINYPDGRCVVIDSKVSLTAYVNMVNGESQEQIEAHARQHLQSVRAHIKELADKNYQEYIGDKKTDFVMMFIPNEAAYMSAMNLDPNLWQEAYDKRVIIISPTHLISVVRLIEQLWRQDDMKRNVIEIATESGRMYDKFVLFVDDLLKIEKNLDATQAAYTSAMKKLKEGSGNLISKAEKLRKMGAKTQKRLSSSIISEDEE